MLYLTLKLFFLAERKGDIGKSAYKTTALFNAFRIVEVSSNSLFWGFFFWMMINMVSGILTFIILIILPSKIYF